MSAWIRLGTACFAMALAVGVAGCSAPRSFPSPSGDQGLSADSPPLPQVICTALTYAHANVAPKSALVYNLPAEMNEPAWGTYERTLTPDGGKPMCPGDTGVWTIRQARIDGSRAQVDIEYPARGGLYQLLTVHMTGAAAGMGYKPEYIQYWKIPVNDPTCHTPAVVAKKYCGGSVTTSGGAGAAGAKPAAAAAAAPAASTAGKTEDPSK